MPSWSRRSRPILLNIACRSFPALDGSVQPGREVLDGARRQPTASMWRPRSSTRSSRQLVRGSRRSKRFRTRCVPYATVERRGNEENEENSGHCRTGNTGCCAVGSAHTPRGTRLRRIGAAAFPSSGRLRFARVVSGGPTKGGRFAIASCDAVLQAERCCGRKRREAHRALRLPEGP